LLVIGGARHAYAGSVENLLGGQIRGTKLLNQLGDKQAICTDAVVDQLAWSSGVQGERAIGRVERGKPRRRCAKTALERISSGSIQNNDLYLCSSPVHLGQQCINADPIPAHFSFGPNLSVDRNEVGLSPNLNSISAEVEECGHPALDLPREGIDCTLHVLLADVFLQVDVEIASTELVGKGTRILDRGGERRAGVGITGVSDNERHARVSLLWQCRRRQHCGEDR
jgi:hypothetical protein